MKNSKIESGTTNLLTLETARRIEEIKNELKLIFEGLEGKYDPKFTADPCPTAGDFQDFLGHLKSQIEEKTDGRPHPIQIETDSDFARCDSPGWDHLATIGDYALTATELRELSKWIESVLAWHSTQPKRTRKTQLETRA